MATLKQIGVNAVSLGEEKRREATGIELQALSGPAISGAPKQDVFRAI